MNILITGGQGDLAKFLTQSLTAAGHQVAAPSRIDLNVADPSSVEGYFSGRQFDIVINAAGTLYSCLVAESDPQLWIRDIEVNLIGTYLICRSALRANKKTKLINIASTAAFNSYKDWTSYCAAKAGVVTLSKGLHKDGYDITVLCPGAIETKLRDNLLIDNPNVMTIAEGAEPILAAINANSNGKLYFYRKNEQTEEQL
ncbi:SDR family NAD(P)-dependent oxidoreductase [Pseudoalteromonas rhizosphaerae]|uniref:SDR family NAD(P)-dependent oxidoreductase n=1 Tax=Pseudoalteromonas rhizosphaerae TaxID=2518973 RepID=UPI0037039653